MANEYTYDEEGETWPFFAIALLVFSLIPLTISYGRRLVARENAQSSISIPTGNASVVAIHRSASRRSRFFNKLAFFLIVGWAAVIYMALYLTKQVDPAVLFDPYSILDVLSFASEREIRLRFRKLSIQFHPDKIKVPEGAGPEFMEEMNAAWIKISLAYKSLTDEVTRENFLRYGHPDGQQPETHGYALPKFLVEGKFSPAVVMVYFLLLGGVLPFVVRRWWADVKSHTKSGLHIDSAAMFTRKLVNRNPAILMSPDVILSWICESQEVKDALPDHSKEQAEDLVRQHMDRVFTGSAETETKKVKLVALLPALIDGLVGIAGHFKNIDVLFAATDLRRCIVQAVKSNGRHRELLQLPGIDIELVNNLEIVRLPKLFAVPQEEAKRALGITDQSTFDSVMDVASRVPTIHLLNAHFEVPGEPYVTTMATAILRLEFLVKSPRHKLAPQMPPSPPQLDSFEYMQNPVYANLEPPRLPYAYAPHIAKDIPMRWSGFFIGQKDSKLIDGNGMFSVDHMDLSNLELSQEQWLQSENVVVSTFRLRMAVATPPQETRMHFRVVLRNNAYFGADLDVPVVMDVRNPPPIEPRKVPSHDDSDDELDISDADDHDALSSMISDLQSNKPQKIREIHSDEESDNESVFSDINTDTEDES